jgi:hypothetical protein
VQIGNQGERGEGVAAPPGVEAADGGGGGVEVGWMWRGGNGRATWHCRGFLRETRRIAKVLWHRWVGPCANDPHPNESPHPNRHPEGARPIAMGEGLVAAETGDIREYLPLSAPPPRAGSRVSVAGTGRGAIRVVRRAGEECEGCEGCEVWRSRVGRQCCPLPYRYRASRPDVDASRRGPLGLSMGSTAWWLAAVDERVKVCVDLCRLSDFQALIAHRSLEGHRLYSFVPGLLEHFTSAQINGLIASRTHLSLAGVYDPLTPLDGLDTIDGELRKVYGGGGAGGVAVVAVWDGACGDGGDAGGDGVIPSSLPVMTVVKEL